MAEPEKKKGLAALIIAKAKPPPTDGLGAPPADEEPGTEDPMVIAADDIIRAVQAGDATSLADALRAAFTQMESEPHDENEPSEPGPEKPSFLT